MSSQKRPGVRNPKSILKSPSTFPLHADAPLVSDQPPFVPPLGPRIKPSSGVPQATTSTTAFGAAPASAPEQQARNRQLAIQHATVLQQRKNTEAVVLANLEELIDFPSSASPSPSAAHPSSTDIARFQTLIQPFQASDYDELLTERNCADRCAYVFCPTILSRDRSARANINRLRYDGSKVVSIKQAKLDQWCTTACARRALYIKVQLSESPAWERAGAAPGTIGLLQEGDDHVLEEKMKGLSIGGDAADQKTEVDADLLQAAMEELALERGETQTASAKRSAVMRDVLVEHPSRADPVPPAFASAGDEVEGYTPRVQRPRKSENSSDDDDDEEEDTDWVL